MQASVESDISSKRIAWVTQLHVCENRNNVPRILDVNGRWSYKFLMFQRSTFDRYGEKYGLPHDDIYSDSQQTNIAINMLNDGLWRAWYTCSKDTSNKLGYVYPMDV